MISLSVSIQYRRDRQTRDDFSSRAYA